MIKLTIIVNFGFKYTNGIYVNFGIHACNTIFIQAAFFSLLHIHNYIYSDWLSSCNWPVQFDKLLYKYLRSEGGVVNDTSQAQL